MEKIKKDELKVGMKVIVNKEEDNIGVVTRIYSTSARVDLPNHSGWSIDLRDDGYWGGNCSIGYTTTEEIPKVMNMELKDVKASNLKEATIQVNKDLMNAEIEFAKAEYKRAKDNIDSLDRQIKNLEEQKKPYSEILAKFK